MTNQWKKIQYIIFTLFLLASLIYSIIKGASFQEIKYVFYPFLILGSVLLLIIFFELFIANLFSMFFCKHKKHKHYMRKTIPKYTSPKKSRKKKMHHPNYSLLYPPNTTPEIPNSTQILEFDKHFSAILPSEDVVFCTKNEVILHWRNELFCELSKRTDITDSMTKLIDLLGEPEDESPLYILKRKKQLLQIIRNMSSILANPLYSAALIGFRNYLNNLLLHPSFKRLEQEVINIPDTKIKSIHLAINVNEFLYPTEAGIVLMSDHICKDAQPLECSSNRAEIALNQEIMKAIEQVILRDLSQKGIRINRILKTEFGLSDSLTHEIRYILAMVKLISYDKSNNNQ